MSTLTLSAGRRREKVVNPSITTHLRELTKKAARALFGSGISVAVATLCAAAIWWHIVTIDDTIAAQHAIALDCIAAAPWAIAYTIRATLTAFTKGGER